VQQDDIVSKTIGAAIGGRRAVILSDDEECVLPVRSALFHSRTVSAVFLSNCEPVWSYDAVLRTTTMMTGGRMMINDFSTNK
jgi:hypothetical protein